MISNLCLRVNCRSFSKLELLYLRVGLPGATAKPSTRPAVNHAAVWNPEVGAAE